MSPTAPPPVRERRVPSGSAPRRPAARPAAVPADTRWAGRRPRRGIRLRSSGRRLRTAAAAMAVLFLLLAGRLVQLQGFQSQSYAHRAALQRTHTVTQPATRGEIVDRAGNVLAVNVAVNDISVAPPQVTNIIDEATALSPLLHQSVADLIVKMERAKGVHFRYLAYDVDLSVGKAITKLALPGVGVLPQTKRLYPAGGLAANVIGTVGRSGIGLAGLESAYNTSLSGKSGTLVVEEDPRGRDIPSGKHQEKSPVPGRGLQLTLDRDIQYEAESALAAEVKASGAIKGVAIVMNPHNGDVYAMASAPGFNPNNPSKITSADLSNPDVAWTFEPGSVNKLVTVSAAIDKGIVTPTSEIDVPGSPTPGISVPPFVIRDSETHPAERLTVAGVLAQSSNLGTLLISRKLPSRAALESELRAFGLGSLTGIGLPGESAGLLSKSSTWSDSTAANIPFGQSMSVTAMQVATAYSTIANGGIRVTPRIIDGTIGGNGKETLVPAGPTHRVVSPQTAKTMQQLLEQVTTTRSGTGAAASVAGYRVAGKTGTANRIDPNTGKYSGYVSSFVGFAPADNPSLVVLVTLDNPQSSIFGGTVAAPVFSKIMAFALATMRVPPTGTTPVIYPQLVG